MAGGAAKVPAFKEGIGEFACAIVSLAFARTMLPFRGCQHSWNGPLMISIQQFVTPASVRRLVTSVFAAAAAVLVLTAPLRAQTATIRIGHFPNITHVQALVAHALSRANKGWFEQRLGPDVKIEWYVYNAGPSAMEAVFAKSIDLTYVGPNPAINAYSKSRGEEVRIIAGAADGGSALVVQGDSTLKTPADFRGKKIATPQFGNTQDVAARAWLVAGGLAIRQSGGDAQVLPAANPDQLSLFQQKQVDAVWTVEPWVSRLELEAKGRVLIDDRSAITTVLVARADYLRAQRDLVRKIVGAHAELTDWIEVNPAEAQKLAAAELLAETRAIMSQQLIERSWPRIVLTSSVSSDALTQFFKSAQSVGFLRDTPDLSRLVEKP
jgi:NitT/TauT family transport system substrate-binding protein